MHHRVPCPNMEEGATLQRCDLLMQDEMTDEVVEGSKAEVVCGGSVWACDPPGSPLGIDCMALADKV